MIDYKLAKQLKDAGFPQEHIELYCIECNKTKTIECFNDEHKSEAISYPTLEELIDACIGTKSITFKLWCGITTFWKAKMDKEVGEGKTRKEAVAKLYIKLKKK